MNVFDLVAVLTLNKSGYEEGLKEAKDEASGIGSKIGSGLKTAAKVGGVALAAAGTATIAFGKSAINAGMEFDSAMSQVAATMGKSVDEIGDLREFAQEMGRTTAFSATEAAEALNYMALAGYDSKTSMKMLPNVLNLAAAGGIDLAYASDMVTDAQSALGLKLDETTQLVDIMAKTSSTTNTSVAQLGEALLTVGGTAKNLAFGAQEASQVLGLLADNGIKGSEGGTALRNVILSLSAPTDKAAAAMERLGMKVFDEEGNMRDLESIFLELGDSLSELTQEEQTVALNEIFNKVDLKSVNALLGTTEKRWREVWEATDHAKGSAEQMKETQLNNLAGDITLFKSALEGARIAVSDQLTPALRGFVSMASEGVSNITAAFQKDGLTGAMGALGDFLGDLIDKIVEMLPEAVDAITELAVQLLDGVVKAVPKLVDKLPEIIDTLIDGILRLLPSLVDGLIKVVMKIVEKLPKIISSLVKAIPTAIKLIVEGLMNNLPQIISGLIQCVIGIVQELPSIITEFVQHIPEIITMIVDGFVNGIPQLVEGAIQLVVELVKHLPEIIAGLIAAIPQILSSIIGAFGPLGGMLGELFTGFMGGVGDILGGMPDLVGPILTEVGNVANSVFSWIGTLMDDPAQAIEDAFDGIVNYGKQAFESVKTIITGIFDLIDAKKEEAEAKARAEELRQKREDLLATGDYDLEVYEQIKNGWRDDATEKTANLEVGGTLRVEGINNEGEFIAAADYTMNQVTKQMERDSRLYSYSGG